MNAEPTPHPLGPLRFDPGVAGAYDHENDRYDDLAAKVAALETMIDELDSRDGLYLLTGPEVAAGVVQRARAILLGGDTSALDRVRAEHGDHIAVAIERLSDAVIWDFKSMSWKPYSGVVMRDDVLNIARAGGTPT